MAGSVQNGPKGPDVSRSGSGKAEKESENKGVQGAPGAQGTQGAKGTADEKGPGKAAGNPPDKAAEKAMAERTGQSQLAAEAKAQIENNTAPAKEKTPAPASSPPETVDAKNPPDLSRDAINPSIGPMDVIGPGAALVGGARAVGTAIAGRGLSGLIDDAVDAGKGLIDGAIQAGKNLVDDVFNGGVRPGANLGISPQKQGKHISGQPGNTPDKSTLTHPNPQGLVNNFAGKGVPGKASQPGTTRAGDPGFKEVVDFQEPIGTMVEKVTGKQITTNVGTIHYSKTGTHVVPAHPQMAPASKLTTGVAAPTAVGVAAAKPEQKPAPKPELKPAPKPAPPKPDPEEAKLADARKEVEKSLEKIEQEMKSISRSSSFMSNSERESGGSQRVEQQYRDAFRRQEVIKAAQTFLNNPDRKNGVPEGALTGALGLGSKEARDTALDRMEKAGADVDTARSLSNRMEKEGWGFDDLMDTSAFNYGGGGSGYGPDTFSTNIADYGDISDLSAFGGYGPSYGGSGSDHNGSPGDGSYGGGMANGDPTPG